MLKRYERRIKIFEDDADEGKDGAYLGYYPLSFCYRTSEEAEESDMLFSNLRCTAYGDAARAPDGGYRRGMKLISPDGGRYTVLVPVRVGRLWILKLEHTVYSGDCEVTL